jgi:hypothetical protein
MNEPLLEPAEQARLKPRAAIAEVELQVSSALVQSKPENPGPSPGALLDSWRKLVPLITPEPEPARRECPHCRRRIMKLATRCMYCLEKSDPPQGD